ncbi:unnamed protein product (macronuclear) [Paramecium tetraurelia]|uniref:arginyltransferase n=1 Tax=Paramecium tetraurelia TaxID=5888 RepID=A0EF09_PARTE|nr:uncharacterized protein GSPATT00026223001 [Paramecium tetraurelia]CAK93900.1 unnamed protein product [Paramecium tetraurelia]|eukprot:XP_001461273.1 hypothetical protein (macronuclear) [Paramecium tetraurelia strain d4-2]
MGSISYNNNIKRGQLVKCKFQLHPTIYLKKIDYFTGNCLFQCGQTCNYISIEDYSQLPIQTYQRLFERLFSKDGDYFYKLRNKICCKTYNMRIVLQKNAPSRKQMKSALALLDRLNLYGQGQDINKKEKLQKEVFNQKDLQHIQVSQQKQAKYRQIHNQEKKTLFDIINSSIQLCKSCFEELTQTENLNFTLQENDLKIFQHLNKIKFYSNANLLLFHLNQIPMKSKNYSLNQFNEFLGIALNKNQTQNELTVQQKPKGFLTLIHSKEQIQNAQCQKQGLANQQQQQKPQKFIQKKQKQQSNFKNKNLINPETFTFQQFQVGPLVITIKDLGQSRDIIDFIYQYHMVVHNRPNTDEEIIKLYCRNYLNTQTVLEDFKQNIKIKLGQRCMEYRLNGKLIALGTIILTQEYFVSEYFFYLPELKNFNFGVFSILVEIEYAKQIQKYFPKFKYHTLGYTSFRTKKMEYKLQFSGTEIQCPDTYIWTEYNDQVKAKMISQDFKIDTPIQVAPLDFSKVTVQLYDVNVKANLVCDDQNQDEISKYFLFYANELGNELMYDFRFIYNEEIFQL